MYGNLEGRTSWRLLEITIGGRDVFLNFLPKILSIFLAIDYFCYLDSKVYSFAAGKLAFY